MTLNTIASFTENLASEAGKNILKYFNNISDINYKSDASLVTEADISTESLIIDGIKARFPQDHILAEETHQKLGAHERNGCFWVIDPLDGTSNFANGYGFFCTSIARYEFVPGRPPKPQIGVIYDPCRDAMYSATAGGGAFKNGRKISIRKPTSLAKAFLVTGFSYVNGSALEFEIDRFKKVATKCQTIRRDGAAALDLALVADGTFHAFWENNLAAWDVAAGALLVSEAGGKVRNYSDVDDVHDIFDGSVIAGCVETVEELAELLV